MKAVKTKLIEPILTGLLSGLVLLVIYFTLVTFLSGADFAREQFFEFWYFLTALSFGFGIQAGLWRYLKSMQKNVSGKLLATSGTASTAAMISCCAHYLVNVLPILGVTGAVTLIAQYQIELFWVGLLFNALGIIYMSNKVIKFSKMR